MSVVSSITRGLARASGARDASPPAPAPARDRRPGERITVLLAEDDYYLRYMMCEVFRAAGYQVLEAADGREALALAVAHSGPIPLLVTDVMMPGMSGTTLAEKVREARPATRVLFITGFDLDPVPAATELLRKPFTPKQLLKQCERQLGEEAMRRTA